MSAENLPGPMVPAEVDLRDFQFMPLDVVRLRDSDLSAVPDGEVFRAAVLSWCVAWHQAPAASLPDDDDVLARLLGYGRDVRGWKKLRAKGALRGWTLCNDGRLYHPVVAEKARDAWTGKMKQRWMTECARIKKHNQRHEMSIPGPEFDDWMSLGCPQGQPLPVPGTKDSCPQGQPPNVPREIDSKGQGEGQGQGEVKDLLSESTEEPSISDCPQQEILKAYAKRLPMLTQPRVWDGSRAATLKARWTYCAKVNGVSKGYSTKAEGVAFWDEFFAYVARQKKLTEGITYADGSGTIWKPDLPWLLKAENFAKVVEGKYE